MTRVALLAHLFGAMLGGAASGDERGEIGQVEGEGVVACARWAPLHAVLCRVVSAGQRGARQHDAQCGTSHSGHRWCTVPGIAERLGHARDRKALGTAIAGVP